MNAFAPTSANWEQPVGGRDPTRGVQPLDEGGLRQRVATSRSLLDSSLRKHEPGNGILRDEIGVGVVGGGDRLASPDDARVLRVLPRGANRTVLIRVGAEEVGDDLLIVVVEQRGLGREEQPGEAEASGHWAAGVVGLGHGRQM